MFHAESEKVVELLAPATVASGSTTSASVDRLGFDAARILVRLPAASATNSSAKWGVLQLSEADVTNVSSATSIVAFTGTTNSVTSSTAGFVIAAQNDTTNPQITEFCVTCVGRKRYLFLTVQSAASHSTTYGVATLARAEQTPATDAKRGPNSVSIIG